MNGTNMLKLISVNQVLAKDEYDDTFKKLNNIISKPENLKFKFRTEKEIRAIRLLFTLALIEEILNGSN